MAKGKNSAVNRSERGPVPGLLFQAISLRASKQRSCRIVHSQGRSTIAVAWFQAVRLSSAALNTTANILIDLRRPKKPGVSAFATLLPDVGLSLSSTRRKHVRGIDHGAAITDIG